jgi:radical SAM protein with 4Fe4S-binding SPASM domain
MDLAILNAYDSVRDLASKPFKAICYAPFTSMFFDTFGLVRTCCVNRRYILGDINKQRLDDIWNGEKTRKIRQAMKDYDLRLGCEHCEWQMNDGNFSDAKAFYSSLHAAKYDEYSVGEDGVYWPSNLEFNLSNTCNLECATCFGEFSSSIRSRREKLPPLPRPYKDEFFDDLEKYIPHVRSAQFLGGEPFLIVEHFRVWEMMVKDGAQLQQVSITTNGTIYNKKVQWVLDNLPVAITMSMDGVTKKTFEAIRVNAKHEEVLENFARFNEYMGHRKGWLTINFTLSRLNWFELADMLLFAEANGAGLCIPTLVAPEKYSMYTLTRQELEPIIIELEKRDAELREKLVKNRNVWSATLDALRHRLQSADSKLAILDLQAGTAERGDVLADQVAKAKVNGQSSKAEPKASTARPPKTESAPSRAAARAAAETSGPNPSLPSGPFSLDQAIRDLAKRLAEQLVRELSAETHKLLLGREEGLSSLVNSLTLESALATYEPAEEEPGEEEPAEMVAGGTQAAAFRGVAPRSIEQQLFAEAQARSALEKWGTGQVEIIHGDADDNILEVISPTATFLDLGLDLVGLKIDRAHALLLDRFGENMQAEPIDPESMEKMDRVVRFGTGGEPAVTLRVIILPTFDDHQRLAGVKMFVARQSNDILFAGSGAGNQAPPTER